MSASRTHPPPLALLASVATFATRACGLVVVAMAILIAIDVLVRKLFGTTLLSGGVDFDSSNSAGHSWTTDPAPLRNSRQPKITTVAIR